MAFSPTPRLYFAYGSSLSLSEMKSRCPTSSFYGIAVLRNHRWFVNERGYANIVPSLPDPNGIEDVVWGILYTLRPFDEELLDKHEGIPWAYSKADMDVEAISITEDGRGTRREVLRALVYIDRERVQESYPWPEFVVKMNKGIQEAVERGLPTTWVARVVKSYIVDPSTVNGTEGQVEAAEVPPIHNAPLPIPTTRPDSDRASQTRDSLVAGQSVNGGSQKGKLTHNGPLHGLEKSKYAHEGNTSGAQRRRAVKERELVASQTKSAASVAQNQRKKMQTCWFWKVKGSCRYSDEECQLAHYETGVVSDAPGKKAKGPLLEKTKAPYQLKNIPREERSPSSKPNTGKENNDQPYGYRQDWSGQQAKAETSASWSEQVENLMDSEPEWLVANGRKDVKW